MNGNEIIYWRKRGENWGLQRFTVFHTIAFVPALGAGGRRFKSSRPDHNLNRSTAEKELPDVRIYQPAKTAMQSGRAKTRYWLLEFEPGAAKQRDRLMGWCGSRDMLDQVRIKFPSAADAIAFAEKNGLDYRVQAPRAHRTRPKSYADNFSAGRTSNWTH